ncbi:PAS domain S-box-containing protein [Halovenus aranensis]|uniref:histidine kinase n=1 Tax=Halovenus aranensis TaxID=890420 RepID=A0A1G8UF58_9EURY|nr:PAS domain S-box protein [Halovenus aranensis]SDJ51650.1 PAS domain S-box-containing protein [Halovenus aranensis]
MNQRIRVLVVDDSEFFGTLVSGELERLYDMEVVQATGSEEALERLDDGFECIVSDYDMPGTDGIELFEMVRDRGFEMPFFLLTAAGSEEVASRAITAGIDDYFPKTSGDDQFDILGNRIKNIVTKRRTAASLERQRLLHEQLWNVTQELLTAGSHEQMCGQVCQRLVEIDRFAFTWVQTPDETTLGSAGVESVDLGSIKDRLADENADGAAWLTSTQLSLADGTERTVVTVPLEHRGERHGSLVVGSEPGVDFRESDRQSLSHLGTTIGHALAATEMRREVELFQTAVEQAETAIAITDTSGCITYANSAFYEITGYEPDSLRQSSVDRLASESFDAGDYERLWDRVTDGETVRREVVQRRRDGGQFVADLSVAPVAVEGELQRFIIVESDITELKAREQRLEVMNRVIRHNLRNDLNVVTGNISLLLSELESEEGIAHAERAQAKIEDLLDLSEKARLANRIVETTNDDEKHTEASLSAVVDAVVTDLDDQYPDATLQATVEESTPVPEGPLEICLRELVTNAIVHDEDSPEVTVSARASATHEGMVEVDIADNGPGIPKVERQTLERGHETDLEHSSSLGLWLVHWVVTFLGGELRIVDAAEDGSTVRILVPTGADD